MPEAPLRKIGEVAEVLGTTPRTLRFYEEEGLVGARRTPGGTRLYSDEDLDRFRAILTLARSGISVSMIKSLATARAEQVTGARASHQVNGLLDGLGAQIRQQIEALERLEADVSAARQAVQGCRRCNNPPTRQGCPECPINGLLASSELLNLIWEQDLEPPGRQLIRPTMRPFSRPTTNWK